MYIGLDIGGTNMVAGLTNGAGKIINKVSRPVNKAWDPAELCRHSAWNISRMGVLSKGMLGVWIT